MRSDISLYGVAVRPGRYYKLEATLKGKYSGAKFVVKVLRRVREHDAVFWCKVIWSESYFHRTRHQNGCSCHNQYGAYGDFTEEHWILIEEITEKEAMAYAL